MRQRDCWACCNCGEGPLLSVNTFQCIKCDHRVCSYCWRFGDSSIGSNRSTKFASQANEPLKDYSGDLTTSQQNMTAPNVEYNKTSSNQDTKATASSENKSMPPLFENPDRLEQVKNVANRERPHQSNVKDTINQTENGPLVPAPVDPFPNVTIPSTQWPHGISSPLYNTQSHTIPSSYTEGPSAVSNMNKANLTGNDLAEKQVDLESVISNVPSFTTGSSVTDITSIATILEYTELLIDDRILKHLLAAATAMPKSKPYFFETRIRRLLRTMSIHMEQEAVSALQKVASKSLSKFARRIARRLREIYYPKASGLKPSLLRDHESSSMKKQQLEHWLRGLASSGHEEIADRQNSRDSDLSDLSEDDTDMISNLPNLKTILAFIEASRAMSNLRQQVLHMVWEDTESRWRKEFATSIPIELKMIEAGNASISHNNTRNLGDKIKEFLEFLTGKPWIWTPFDPPIRVSEIGRSRIKWKCVSTYIQRILLTYLRCSVMWHDQVSRYIARTCRNLSYTRKT